MPSPARVQLALFDIPKPPQTPQSSDETPAPGVESVTTYEWGVSRKMAGSTYELTVSVSVLLHNQKSLIQQIDQLRKKGVLDATSYYQRKGNSQYLYINYQEGPYERKRKYIGIDPSAQRAVLDQIARFKELVPLEEKLDRINAVILEVTPMLEHINQKIRKAYQ
jgi:hypothetical protein